jgi:hypothetical protein
LTVPSSDFIESLSQDFGILYESPRFAILSYSKKRCKATDVNIRIQGELRTNIKRPDSSI